MARRNVIPARCSVGVHDDSPCFLSRFVKEDFSFVALDDLDQNVLKTLQFGVRMSNIPTICNHHKLAFTTRFPVYKQGKKCSDPFGIHPCNKKNPMGNGTPTLEQCEVFAQCRPDIHLFPGQRLCVTCKKKLYDPAALTTLAATRSSSISTLSDVNAEPPDILSDDAFDSPARGLNKSVSITKILHVSPVVIDGRRSKERRELEILKKANEVRDAYINLHSGHLNSDVLTSPSPSLDPQFLVGDLQNQMIEIRARCLELKRAGGASGVMTLLTLVPSSWSQQETANFFSVSISEVKRSRILKKEKGILGIPDKKKGRKITVEEIEIIQEFFLSDEHSRIMPGMNDYISVQVKEGEKKTKMQKRLLLLNIDELFFKYKEFCLAKLCMKACSKSKFFEMRPKHVIGVGSTGTHNVCVCEKHQNVKLMIDSILDHAEKYFLMNVIVCDVYNYVCMMNRCENCPGTQPLRDFLNSQIGDRQFVKFKRWESTDRTTLENVELLSDDFISMLIDKIDHLTTHHYVSKSQSKFCRELKANLPVNHCLLQGDFSQNYSMLSQDSTQSSFFSPPPQCTIHTFLAYLNIDGVISHHSMCVFSDFTTHNTVAVHSFLQPVIKHIHSLPPNLIKIVHFTDGAGSQYKNLKNFSNLVYHQTDFNVAGEWHFLPRAMGKALAMA